MGGQAQILWMKPQKTKYVRKLSACQTVVVYDRAIWTFCRRYALMLADWTIQKYMTEETRSSCHRRVNCSLCFCNYHRVLVMVGPCNDLAPVFTSSSKRLCCCSSLILLPI